MCNIAGYVGTRPAAPILLEMMRREEGFDGGYYAGIATLDNGKIYYEKLVGHVQMLIDQNNAATLPGTIGLCHSRSKGSGDGLWAHPFVSEKNGEIVSAYIANGNYAPFSDKENDAKIAWELINRGYGMRSKTESTSKGYPRLPDNTVVHVSDISCQLITKLMDEDGLDAPSAMEKAFRMMPLELVGLFLNLKDNDSISWARTNMPIFIAFANHGAYVASTPTAFPDDAGEPHIMLPYTYGRIYKDTFTVSPFSEKKAKVAAIDAKLRYEAYKTVTAILENGPADFKVLKEAVAPLFEEADVLQFEAAVYEVLYSLKKQGKLKIEPVFAPGPYGNDVPKNIMTLI